MTETIADYYGPWAVIAGGSEGIGLAFARRLASEGMKLILIARTAATLDSAASELRAEFEIEVRTQAMDLTAIDLAEQVAKLSAECEIGLMIYNAGAMHGTGLFLDRPLEDARKLVDLNCHGPLIFCHSLGRQMRERGRGGIVLLSSMSGLGGGAYTAAYGASKSFDITLAEALWAELGPSGVHVLGLICGATDTPAMARSGIAFGEGSDFVPMDPDDVAAEGLAALPNGPLHVAGEGNRAVAEILRGERKQAIEFLSMGAAMLYGEKWPL